MRVLTAIHSFEPGGVERVALRLVGAWRDAGLDAPLWVGRTDGAMRGELADGLRYLTPARAPWFVAAVETLWMVALLPGVIRRLRPDVLFCPGNSYAVIAVMMRLLLGRDCPAIVLKVSNDLERLDLPLPIRWGYRQWLRWQGRAVTRWIAIADGLDAEITALTGAVPARVEVIANPVLPPAALLAPLATTTARPGRRFVAIGRLVRQKNLALLLDAFATAAEPADRLTIIGGGPDGARLARQVARLGLADRVTLTGHCPDAGAALAEHDVLLLSSRYEGLPGAVVEALAAGLPVVATDCSRGMAPLLDGGRLGILVPVGDAAALAAAMGRVRPDGLGAERRHHVAAYTVAVGAPRFVHAFARAVEARAAERGRPVPRPLTRPGIT